MPVDSANDRLATLEIYDLAAFSAAGVSGGFVPYSPQVFYDAAQLRAHHASAPAAPMAPPPKAKLRSPARLAPTPSGLGRRGQQAQLIYDGLRRGKTLAVEEVAQQWPEARLFRIEGKELLLDVDFLGNIVPREDQRVWQDGPLAEAIQSAQCDPVLLFVECAVSLW